MATSTDEGETWTYEGVVLEEDHHLSYPQVFAADGEIWMVPESGSSGAVTLYRAERFPDRWTSVTTLLEGELADPTIVRHEHRWWIFAADTGDEPFDTLRLFFSDELVGPYREHPASPVVKGDPSRSRPGGRILDIDGELYRFVQDNRNYYGEAVRAVRIKILTPTHFEEVLIDEPIIAASGEGWNANGMHHVDAVNLGDGTWLTAVDGFKNRRLWFDP